MNNNTRSVKVNNRPGKKEKKAITVWRECVRRAKKKLERGTDSWGILSDKVLKEAMTSYCAMGY